MSNDNTTPIQVNATPTADQIAAGIRQAILVFGGLLGGLGYANLAGQVSGLVEIAGPLAAVVVFVWGQIVTHQKAKKMVAVAKSDPANVVVK